MNQATGESRSNGPNGPSGVFRLQIPKSGKPVLQLTQSTLQSEQEKYNDVWRDKTYRVKCHGLDFCQSQRSLFPPAVESAIDLGHGTGRLVKQWDLEGVDAWGVDLAKNAADPEIAREIGDHLIIAPLWEFEPPHRLDIGVCADVLEHIPQSKLDQGLENIAEATELAYLKIACFDHVHLGHKLHMSVHPPIWWNRAHQCHRWQSCRRQFKPERVFAGLVWSTR